MHKDQKRIQDALLPSLLDRIIDDSPEAQRDCTAINRLFLQGPDPLYLMETNPAAFADLCTALRITVEQGRAGIEAAHWQGPAVLMEENEDNTWGLISNDTWTIPRFTVKDSQEALWLILAACSDCTEEEYAADITMLQRVQRATAASVRVCEQAFNRTPGQLLQFAQDSLINFERTTEFVFDAEGRPHGTEDHAFYIAYKQGHPVCAVHTKGPTFWGTVPTTSLNDQGLTVDKQISPQFGLILEDSRAALETLKES